VQKDGIFGLGELPNKGSEGKQQSESKKVRTKSQIFIWVIAVIAVIYGILMLVESYHSGGFVPVMAVSDVDYDVSNPMFDKYVPTVNVSVTFGDEETLVNTPEICVEEILAELGIYLDDNDRTDVPLDTIAYDEMKVVVSKIDEVEVVSTRTDYYETIVNPVKTVPKGEQELVQEGENGITIRVIRQTYENGKLTDEVLVSETVEKAVSNRIINEGTGGIFYAPDGKAYRYSHYIDVEATAYSGEQFPGLTFTGKQVEVGMIAVDPDVIELGSKCYVIGDAGDFGVMYAEDTGSKILGKAIDIFMLLTEEALRFGRQPMRVYILE